MATMAGNASAGPRAKAALPRIAQDCSSQATFSGANSRAPRWSVVGLTGKVTPWSRESSSRPPPDDTPDTTVRTKNAANIVGISSSTSRARPSSWAPGNSAGSVQTASVMLPMIANAVGSARRRRTVAVRKRSR